VIRKTTKNKDGKYEKWYENLQLDHCYDFGEEDCFNICVFK